MRLLKETCSTKPPTQDTFNIYDLPRDDAGKCT